MRQNRPAHVPSVEKQHISGKAPYSGVSKLLGLFLLANMMLLAGEVLGQTPSPCIEFVQTVYDYDTIEQNSDGRCTFTFKNTGNAPLLISNASTSCGCTKPQFSTRPILPDRTGRITVRYNTSLVGSFRKTIVVKSNATNQSTAILFIKGFVKKRKSGCLNKEKERCVS